MKPTYRYFLASVFCLVPLLTQGQSTLEFQSGTNIEVTAGADICADNVTINGTYSGTGTQCGGALPVELVSMSCVAGKNTATLNWTTATETGNLGFEIERRSVQASQTLNFKPETWNSIGFVQGSGTSSSRKDYSFADQQVTPGRYAYRIKQIDQSGAFSYTAAIEVEIGLAPKEFTLSQNYPNPFNPTTTIEFTLPEDGHVALRMYDVTGREVATFLDEERTAGYYHQITIDASRFGSGSYFLRLEFGGQQLTRRIVLVK